VYLNYGIHPLVNTVTEADGSPAAVLIRALDPVDGIATMQRRRARRTKGRGQSPCDIGRHDLCRGPGNLTMAMGITLQENERDLCGSRLFVEDQRVCCEEPIRWGPRIGISVGTERRWRAYLEGHPSLSGRRASRE
jgi:DNA-3-methyladenine glycosylase